MVAPRTLTCVCLWRLRACLLILLPISKNANRCITEIDNTNRLGETTFTNGITKTDKVGGLSRQPTKTTQNNKILDLLCTNKPDLFSDIRSIPGISDHEIILADCDLKPVVCKKPPRTIYLWNRVDWNKFDF